MTRPEREQLIARYLNGDMPITEEHDFFIQVALDSELRNELKAHRMVDESARDYRNRERTPHTALRARTMAMLAAYPAARQTPAPPSGWLSRTGESIRSLTGQQTMWIILAILGVGIAGASFLLPEFTDPPPANTLRRMDTGVAVPHTVVARPANSTPVTAQPTTPGTITEPETTSANEERREPQQRGGTTLSSQTAAREALPSGSVSREPLSTAKQRTPRIPAASKRRGDDSIGVGINVTIDPKIKK
jgi:hypothetical protein